MFTSTSDHALYPNPAAFAEIPRASELYIFLGKVVGKAIYEMFLLEPQFSRVFLNRVLGRINEAPLHLIEAVSDLFRSLKNAIKMPCSLKSGCQEVLYRHMPMPKVDDISSLDKELHRNMLQIKEPRWRFKHPKQTE